MKTLIEKTSDQLAKDYRAALLRQKSSGIGNAWKFGPEIKALKNAFFVVRESEQIRIN